MVECRGGWRGKERVNRGQAGTEESSANWLELSEDAPPLQTQPDKRSIGFKSLPTRAFGVQPLKGKAFNEKAKPQSQFAELRKMLGTGPVLDGVRPSEIQHSKCLHRLVTPKFACTSASMCTVHAQILHLACSKCSYGDRVCGARY